MTPESFNRLQALRMENDEAGFAMAELRPRFERLASRHENGTAPRAVSAYQLFQTPPDIATCLVAGLCLQPGARVLEPSAGLGRLLDALRSYAPREVVAVELAANIAGELYRQQRPGVTLLQRDFLDVSPEDIGLFDAVVMNPPFHLRSDIRHIQHATTFLKRGGRLAAICFNTEHRRKAFSILGWSWTDLPAGAFAKEGTHVPTAIVTYIE